MVEVEDQNQPTGIVTKKGHRFLLAYLIIILVALAAGGVYAWQHNKVNDLSKQVADLNTQLTNTTKTDDTSNKDEAEEEVPKGYQKFSVDNEGYSFYYRDDSEVTQLFIEGTMVNIEIDGSLTFAITTNKVGPGYTCDERILEQSGNIETEVAGIKAYQDEAAPEGNYMRITCLIKDKKIYKIYYYYEFSSKSKYLPEYEKLLESFKFEKVSYKS